mgnify:CR=1 FL=1
MALDPDSDTADDTDDPRTRTAGSVLSAGTLSDLTVNAVPIAMLVAFVVGFGVLAPGGLDSDPLLGFHAALIAGVVLVSAVAARAVVASGGDLDGDRAVRLYETSEPDDADDSGHLDDAGDGSEPDAPAGADDSHRAGDARDDEHPRHNS